MLVVLLLLFSIAAHAEEEHRHGEEGIPTWYDSGCCSNRDCRPVADGVVQNLKDGVDVKGFGIMSYQDPRLRWSRDQRDHICEDHSYINGVRQTGKLRCVYRRYMGG